MAELVYGLCALTSLACAILLFRGYGRAGARLLLWSGLCFVGLTVNNGLLLIDAVLLPQIPLGVWRGLAGVVGLAFLLYGMIWDVE